MCTRRIDGDPEDAICQSKVTMARPKKARSTNGQWKYVVNTDEYVQTLRLEKCLWVLCLHTMFFFLYTKMYMCNDLTLIVYSGNPKQGVLMCLQSSNLRVTRFTTIIGFSLGIISLDWRWIYSRYLLCIFFLDSFVETTSKI